MTQPYEQELWTPANRVTLARILLIPLFVLVLVAPWPDAFPASMQLDMAKPWIAAAVFIILSLTDMLDGYLARSRGEVTDFGKFMDPLADKLLVTAALLGLVELAVIPSWVALVIISREFIVSGVRMVAASKGEVIAASWYGKVKTVFQMIAIVLFIIKDSDVIYVSSPLRADWLYIFSWFIMIIALALTIISMIDYLYKARHLIGFRRRGSEGAEIDALPLSEQASLCEFAEEVIERARETGVTLATAESCTGGLIASELTSIAGSSDVYLGSVVSYANEVKQGLLGVSSHSLETVGAVSEAVACQMAEGARNSTGADYAVSVTGIAGPGGGSVEKPVGTVWIGLAGPRGSEAHHFVFSGDRGEVRAQTVEESLRLLLAILGA